MFNDKTILITGGTGAFGHMFTKIFLNNYKPKKVIIFSRDELKQFEMQQVFNDPCMRYFIGDVRDQERLNQAMQGVDFVIHTAELRQVSSAEYNPMECIKTNIHGSECVIKAAILNNVEKVISLSTDKAANPINLYGATKLASDKLFVAANNMVGLRPTRFAVVRCGNVVGTRGSVVPFFKRLIARGAEELPVTNVNMTRFWITLEQGALLVLKNFERMKGGEIFVPKLPSIRIIDLAKSMKEGVGIKIVGIRPGEKLHETMCPSDDSHLTYEFSDYYLVAPSIYFAEKDNDYSLNSLNEKGKLVEPGFEYTSETNKDFLTIDKIKAYDRVSMQQCHDGYRLND